MVVAGAAALLEEMTFPSNCPLDVGFGVKAVVTVAASQYFPQTITPIYYGIKYTEILLLFDTIII